MNENNDNFSRGIHEKTSMRKVFKDSYNLLKVSRSPSKKLDNESKNKKEKKDTRIKTNMKAYLEVTKQGLERLSWSSTTKHNKQKITIKENMQTINDSCLEEQQPTINQLPKINKVNFVAAVGQKFFNNTVLLLYYLYKANNEHFNYFISIF